MLRSSVAQFFSFSAQSFSPWSACTVTCGGGTRTRTVICKGEFCCENSTQTESCGTDPCGGECNPVGKTSNTKSLQSCGCGSI